MGGWSTSRPGEIEDGRGEGKEVGCCSKVGVGVEEMGLQLDRDPKGIRLKAGKGRLRKERQRTLYSYNHKG